MVVANQAESASKLVYHGFISSTSFLWVRFNFFIMSIGVQPYSHSMDMGKFL